MRLAACVGLALLLLAGCGAKPGAAPTSSPTPCRDAFFGSCAPSATGGAATETVPAPTTTPAPAGPKPANVHIHETGDASNGASGNYSWTLAPGFKRAAFAFDLDAPNGLPEVAASNLQARLIDPAGKTAGETGSTFDASPSGCQVCMEFKPGQAATGPWAFTFAMGPSLATWTVDVDVEY